MKLSPEKTKCFIKKGNDISEVDFDKEVIIKENANIDYLGFSYNGKFVKIRERTVSKYYRKMYAIIKTINKYSVKTGKNIGRRKLYKQYSYSGKKTKNPREGNFLTYVDRAKKEYGEFGNRHKQVKKSWNKMSRRLIKIK